MPKPKKSIYKLVRVLDDEDKTLLEVKADGMLNAIIEFLKTYQT